jgi:hypothetical protein
MTQTGQNDTHMDNLLSALTDALLHEEQNIDPIIARHNVPRGEVEQLLTLMRRLRLALVVVKPSRRYTRRLKRDLVGVPARANVINQVRYLPPRVQIAAGIALVAGFMLLTRSQYRAAARVAAREAAS